MIPVTESGTGLTDRRTTVDLITTGQAARALGLSPSRVNQMVAEGKLDPAQRTPLGMLFDRAVVEKLAAERAEAASA